MLKHRWVLAPVSRKAAGAIFYGVESIIMSDTDLLKQTYDEDLDSDMKRADLVSALEQLRFHNGRVVLRIGETNTAIKNST